MKHDTFFNPHCPLPAVITPGDTMKKPPRICLTLTSAAVTGLLALSATAQEAPQDGVYKDRIDWGVQMDMSGPTAEAQSTWVKGFQDYMRKVNEAGGIGGRKINVLRKTTSSTRPRTRSSMRSSSPRPRCWVSQEWAVPAARWHWLQPSVRARCLWSAPTPPQRP